MANLRVLLLLALLALAVSSCSESGAGRAGAGQGPGAPSGVDATDASVGYSGSSDAGGSVPEPGAPDADSGAGGRGGDGTTGGSGRSDAHVRADIGPPPSDAVVGIGERPDETCGWGAILGLVCSPSDQVFVNGATVWVETLDCDGVTPVHIEALTDEDGNYALYGVPSGYQTVYVKKGDFEADHQVLVKAGKTTDVSGFGYKQCFQVTGGCEAGAITGQICEADGEPLGAAAHVWVTTYDCDLQQVTIETTAGPDGAFQLDDVPPGKMWVFMELGNQTVQVQVEVSPGETTAVDPWDNPSACFSKDPCGFGSLTGRLCVPEGDAWVAGAKVWVDSVDCDGKLVHTEAQSDADGVFWLSGVPEGSAWVHVSYGGGGYQQQIQVVKGTTTDTGVLGATSCNPGGGCGEGGVKGYVCAPSGVKVTGATVTVKAKGCNGEAVVLTTTSDGNGNFQVGGVPAGTVTVHVEKGDFSVTYTVPVADGQVTDAVNVVESVCFPDKQVKIAVVTGDWDTIEHILDKLGLSYDLYDGQFNTSQALSLLTNQQKLLSYDVVFFDCGAQHYGLVSGNAIVQQNLKQLVLAGGSIYASDWAFVYAEFPWPQAIDFYGSDTSASGPKVGNKTTVTGTVVDQNLAQFLGKANVTINYDLSMWVVVQAAGPASGVHITGHVFEAGGTVPLMLSHAPNGGPGRVLFTTFHNENQVTADMKQILYYLVFEL